METGTLLGYSGIELLRSAFAAIVAILFLQSGLSKVFSWKGELEWLTGHFGRSPLKGTVPLLLTVITVVELAAGTCSGIGLVQVLLDGGASLGAWGMALGTLAIILLFFGQRVAKDYAGAAALIPYFLMTVAGLYFFMAA